MISEIQGNCLNKIIKTFTKCQSVLVLGALVGNFDKNIDIFARGFWNTGSKHVP